VEGQEDSDSDDEDIEGVWDVQMASFREVDKCDEGASEERGGDFDFGFFFGESTSTEEEEEEESDDEEVISSEGDVSPHANTTDPSGETNNTTPRMLFSKASRRK